MSDVQSFVILLGLLLAGLVVIAAWLFRSSSAPLATKLALPTLMLGCALLAGQRFVTLLGRPVLTTLAGMPERVSLIAFKALDNDQRVDLWIVDGGSTRAYEIPLDEGTKRILRKAQGELAQGRSVLLSQHRTRRAGAESAARMQIDRSGEISSGFELDTIPSNLPPKS